MATYMIHTMPKRIWYVHGYLVLSMQAQGIEEHNIIIYNDSNGEGCLESTMKSWQLLPKDGCTWHLQDDVIICSDFKERTEKLEQQEQFICGFCSTYDKDNPGGSVYSKQMWYSFPCICIPNWLALECSKWFYSYLVHNEEYRMWIRAKKYDDSIFKIFMEDEHPNEKAINIIPNLVNHIDYLIGGSVANKRDKIIESLYWEEPELVENLKQQLIKDGRYESN